MAKATLKPASTKKVVWERGVTLELSPRESVALHSILDCIEPAPYKSYILNALKSAGVPTVGVGATYSRDHIDDELTITEVPVILRCSSEFSRRVRDYASGDD